MANLNPTRQRATVALVVIGETVWAEVLQGGAKKSRRRWAEAKADVQPTIVRVDGPMPDPGGECDPVHAGKRKLTEIGGSCERYVRSDCVAAATRPGSHRMGKARPAGRTCLNKAASSDRRRHGRHVLGSFSHYPRARSCLSVSERMCWRLRAVCLRDAPEVESKGATEGVSRRWHRDRHGRRSKATVPKGTRPKNPD